MMNMAKAHHAEARRSRRKPLDWVSSPGSSASPRETGLKRMFKECNETQN